MIIRLAKNSAARLRIIGLLEGLSLIVLVLVAMPIKYFMNDPSWVQRVGPVHGFLFVLFVIQTLQSAYHYRWNFWKETFLVLLSCLIPFGNFWVDQRIIKSYFKNDVNNGSHS